MRVGFIGLGAMATRLCEHGHAWVTMVHRDRSKAGTLEAQGATVVDTPAAVARNCDLVITILPADDELRDVTLGRDGLVEGMRSGQTLIDMTTATPATLDHVAARPGSIRSASTSSTHP